MAPLRAIAGSFDEIQCAPGFQCVSKVKTFGLGHDGNFDKPATERPPPRFDNPLVYEVGCPTHGQMNSAGLCEKGKTGSKGMCYSSKRYDSSAGPCAENGAGSCMCVRTVNSNGSEADDFKSKESLKGEELLSGRFLTQPASECRDCGEYDADMEKCNECLRCEFGTKSVEVKGSDVKRKQLGCFQRVTPPGEPKVGAFLYLEGKKAVMRDLSIVPHYRFWEPSEPDDGNEDASAAGDLRLPFQSRREPLSSAAWREAYKKTAPQVQKVMDLLAAQLLGSPGAKLAWTTASGPDGTRSSALKTCWTPDGVGDDIGGKLDKFLQTQRACKSMQETALRLASVDYDEEGEEGFAQKACGEHFQDPATKQMTCGCSKTADGKRCEALNCYAGEDAEAAVKALREQMQACSKKSLEALEAKKKPEAGNAAPEANAKTAAASAVFPAGALALLDVARVSGIFDGRARASRRRFCRREAWSSSARAPERLGGFLDMALVGAR